jgi:hypothetical protein
VDRPEIPTILRGWEIQKKTLCTDVTPMSHCRHTDVAQAVGELIRRLDGHPASTRKATLVRLG